MATIKRLLFVPLFLAPIGSSTAQELERVYMPVVDGRTISYLAPRSWHLDLKANTPRMTELPDPSKGARFEVLFSDPTDHFLKRTDSAAAASALYLRNIVASFAKSGRGKGWKTLRQGDATLLGTPAHFYEAERDDRAKQVRWGAMVWRSLYRGRHFVSANFLSGNAASYEKWRPVVPRMAASVRLVNVEDVPRDIALLYRYDGARVRLSYRRGYYFDARIRIYHGAGWRARVLVARAAGPENERGAMAVELTPPQVDGGAAAGRVVVALSGLPVRPLGIATFLEMAPRLLATWFGTAPRKLDETTARIGGFAWLANSRPRRGESTGATYVRTYRVIGKDGTTWRVRAFSAGGMTAVADVFVMAPEKGFAAFASQVGAWIYNARLLLYSNAFRYGPR